MNSNFIATNDQVITDATNELNRQLSVGSFSERLMRVYALSEIVSMVSPLMLLNAAANIGVYFPNIQKGEDEESKQAA